MATFPIELQDIGATMTQSAQSHSAKCAARTGIPNSVYRKFHSSSSRYMSLGRNLFRILSIPKSLKNVSEEGVGTSFTLCPASVSRSTSSGILSAADEPQQQSNTLCAPSRGSTSPPLG